MKRKSSRTKDFYAVVSEVWDDGTIILSTGKEIKLNPADCQDLYPGDEVRVYNLNFGNWGIEPVEV